jgi:hypothetical protein
MWRTGDFFCRTDDKRETEEAARRNLHFVQWASELWKRKKGPSQGGSNCIFDIKSIHRGQVVRSNGLVGSEKDLDFPVATVDIVASIGSAIVLIGYF